MTRRIRERSCHAIASGIGQVLECDGGDAHGLAGCIHESGIQACTIECLIVACRGAHSRLGTGARRLPGACETTEDEREEELAMNG
jgi:hypothetical protein